MTHQPGNGEKEIASNPSARRDYEVLESVEAGIVLLGTEVKSLREHAPSLKEVFIEILPTSEGFTAWVVNWHIHPYSHGSSWNHDPLRKRALLLHAHQFKKLYGAVLQKGMTLIALRLYWKKGRAKLAIGLAKGKKHWDKRADLKKKEVQRDLQRQMRTEN